jgi:hypothetical protein
MRHFIALVLLLVTTAAIAADNSTSNSATTKNTSASTSTPAPNSTEQILNASHATNVLTFTLSAKPKSPGVITYTTVDENHGGILHDGDTLVSPGAVDLSYHDFNPLTVSVSSSQQSKPDPIQASIDQIKSILNDTAKVIVPEKPSAGNPVSLDCAQGATHLSDAVKLKVHDDKQASAAFEEITQLCARCAAVVTAASTANLDIKKLPVSQIMVQKWIDEATGHDGVVLARKDVEAAIKAVSDHKKQDTTDKEAAETALADLTPLPGDIRGAVKKYADYDGLVLKALSGCDTVMENLPQLQHAISALQTQIEQESALLDSLNQLLAVLKTYEAMRWRNGNRDVVFDTVDTNADNIITVKLELKLITYSFNKDKSTVDQTADTDETRSFDVRLERRLISEYGVAAVYNDLRYPTYSIGDDGTVKKAFDKSNVDVAATINFLCGSCIGQGVYPGFQFGVSKAKDYPGLLAGGVLRFGGTNRIAVASGVMVTWYKDLNGLHVGDTATADKLKADLKLRRSPAAWYLAVQYTFQ